MRYLRGALIAAMLLGCDEDSNAPTQPTAAGTASVMVAEADSVILVVAGDVHANCTNSNNRAKATAAIVKQYPQALVIPLGDNAGQHGTVAEHQCYNQSWGAFKDRTYPTIGNHELNQDTAGTAYYDYFNGVGVDSGPAGHRGRGYYTLDHGSWRILVANNQRNLPDQLQWMSKTLAASPQRCVLATWHRPLFSSGARSLKEEERLRRWWKALYNGGADLILVGHVHNYERFAELNPDGVVDTARGLRQFVVGTGGTGLEDFLAVPRAGSQKRLKSYGVLKLTLWPTRYKWQFIDLTGVVRDQGQDSCH